MNFSLFVMNIKILACPHIFINFFFFNFLQSRRKNAVNKKQRKTDNLDDLKQELDIDYHKISVEELYQRFGTHPDTVRIIL